MPRGCVPLTSALVTAPLLPAALCQRKRRRDDRGDKQRAPDPLKSRTHFRTGLADMMHSFFMERSPGCIGFRSERSCPRCTPCKGCLACGAGALGDGGRGARDAQSLRAKIAAQVSAGCIICAI